MLEKTQVIVKDIRHYTSLDSLDTLTDLVAKLPYDLKKRWVRKAVQIENSFGHLANFSHFVEFVVKESEEVNSLFGLRSLRPKSASFKSLNKTKSSFATVATKSTYNATATYKSSPRDNSSNKTTSNSVSKFFGQSGYCWFCKDTSHTLFDCKRFKEEPVQDRLSFVKNAKLCHKCLSARHRTPDCPKKNNSTCSIAGCKGLYHHTLLHRFASSLAERKKPKTFDVSTSTSESTSTIPVTCGLAKPDVHESQVYLCVVPVNVTFRDKVVSTYAFLDQGSTHSFCANSLIQELGIEGTRKNLHLRTITGTADNYESMSCNLIVSDLSNETSFSLLNVQSVESIPVRPNNVSVDSEVCNLPHLKDIPLKSLPPHASVNLLIGADVPELFCIYSARKGPRGTPCAIETPLGWSLLRPSLFPSQESNCTVNFISPSFNHEVSDLVEKMWNNEFESGTSIFDFPSSKEDRIAYALMQSTVCVTDNHYQLPLLWKKGFIYQLPDNLKLAQRRLASLKGRLERDNELRTKYTEVMNSYLSKGYAQKVLQFELSISKQPTWYLPHHPVTNVNKPGKVRVDYDCAAKCNGMSLNDALMKGPHLMNSLTGVLSRFCKERIAMVADVEAMFHQIKVDPSHINALRFLWWENGDLSKEPVVCQMLVHLFGAASSPSCANFSLRQTAVEFGDLYKPIISSIINNNFYVDDCLVSLPSAEEAIYVYHNLTSFLARRGFYLTKWITNHEAMLNEIPKENRSKKAQQHLLGYSTEDRVLGIQWKVNLDHFTFNVKLPDKPFTRRGILSTVASLFDPLGFVAPVLLEAKQILQTLNKRNLGWDEPIAEVEFEQWRFGLEGLPVLNSIEIPRCFKSPEFGRTISMQIHHFADASSNGYGACFYLRLVDHSGSICLSFFMGKSRLAPTKPVSIPRLELTAAVLAARLDELAKRELKIPLDSFFWVESTAVLYCIRNITKRFPVFVANRLATIESLSSINQWNYVPSKLNPADIASRGLKAQKLKTSEWL